MTNHGIRISLATMLLAGVTAAACSSGASVTTGPGGQASVAAPTASPTPTQADTATTAPPSPSPTVVAAACLSPEILTLLKVTDIRTLTTDQKNQLATALSGYDFGTDTTGASLRDQLLAALQTDQAQAYFEVLGRHLGVDLKFARCP